MQKFYNKNFDLKSFIKAVKTFAILIFSTLLSLTAVANVYVPNTLTDPVITTLNNATGQINGGATISLRSALMAADNLGGTHTITLSTGTYNLTQAIPNRQITIGNTAQNITINGNGPTNTIISNTLDANKDRILFINPSGTTNSPVITVSGIRFQNAFLSSDPFGGAAICAGGGSSESLTVTNCTFDNNVIPANGYGGAAICMQVRGNLTVDNCTFTNNVSNDADGGAILFIIFNSALGTSFGTLNVTNSTFTSNSVVFPGAPTSNGGALAFTGQAGVTPFNATINNNTFISNTADGLGGAIVANNSPNLSIPQIHFNRFFNNTSTASALSSGLHFVESSGSVNAENNWWGCNTNPVNVSSTSPCNQAGGDVAGGGSLDANPWLQLKTTASPTQICTNSTSTITASFLTNSDNTAVGLANLSRVIGLPISFVNPVLGTLSGAQTTIQASGTATVTYTSGAAGGTGSVNAVVDNIPNNEATPAKASIFVSKPVVTNPVTTGGTVNIAFSQNFVASAGVAPYTYSTASTLPANLTLSSAGVLSGTPVVVGTFPIVVNTLDAIGCTGSGSTYNLVLVCQVIPVTNPGVTTGIVGTAFSQTFTSSNTIGSTTYTINSGSLPTGLSLSSAGVLSGTPTQSGSFPITVKVTDANGCTGIGSTYTLVISCQTITVTNPGVTTGTNGTAFSQTFTQTGALSGATFTTVSTLPNGLTLSTAGVLSGTPSAPAATYPIVAKVTDGNGCTGTGATYNLVISCQTITVTNPAVTTGQQNAPFSQTFTQTGGISTITFTTASALPNGITLATSGVLSGTPTVTGTFPIVVKATDANGCFGNGPTYTLVISVPTSAPGDYFRTRITGNWSTAATWESSPVADFSSAVVSPATLAPDFNANVITIRNTHTVTVTANLTTDQTVVNSGGAVIVNPAIVFTINDGTGTDVTVSSGGSFTLKSTAAGTASVGNSAGTTSGNFTIERYIPARRAWRFLAAPLSSTGAPTINASWQEGVTTASVTPNPNPGFGTHITGGITANGFDQNPGNPSSLKIYNNITPAIDQNNWVGVATTLTPITGQQGYMIFIRGSRANNLSQGQAAVADNTTLRMTGGLKTGTQNLNPIDATGYTVIGNPYASPINLNALAKTNGSTNIADNYYVWDPKMAGTFGVGAYVNILWNPGTSSYDITPAPVSAVSQYIQSGEAFFATSTGSAGNLIIKETDKTVLGSDNVFRVISPASSEQKIRTNLYEVNTDGTTSIVDGTLNSYSNIFSNAIDKFDAAKLTNFGENFGIVRDGKTFIVERRDAIGDDINFKMWQMNQQGYQLEVIAENIDPGITAFLEDKYLKTTTPLNVSGTTKVNFAVTADVASAAENRFSIVFGKSATVVQSNISIYPNPVTNGIINLRFDNMPQGNYLVRVVNNLGQTIVSRQISHVQGNSIETLQVTGKGVYHVEITKPDNSKFSAKVIAN